MSYSIAIIQGPLLLIYSRIFHRMRFVNDASNRRSGKEE